MVQKIVQRQKGSKFEFFKQVIVMDPHIVELIIREIENNDCYSKVKF